MATSDERNDIRRLKHKRGALKGQITRTLHLLKSKGSSVNDAPGRLNVAEEAWHKFISLHEDILQIEDEDDFEQEEDYRADVEEVYLEIRALLQPFFIPNKSTDEHTTSISVAHDSHVPNINFTPYTENETFKNFLMRLENYFQLKKITDEKTKTCLFVSTLSPEMHQTLCDTLAPELPGDKTFNELTESLKNCLEPSPSILANQHKFVCKVQEPGENIAVYARELKRLATDCDFYCYNCESTVSDMFLKMQFIRGLKDNEIRIRLLQEKDGKISYNEVVQTAISIEQSKSESYEINRRNGNTMLKETANINRLQSGYKDKQSQFKGNKPIVSFEDLRDKCYRCGSEQHKANLCRFKNEFCRKCNKIGHISRVCLSRSGTDVRTGKNKELKSNLIDIEDNHSSIHEVYTMGSTSSGSDKFLIDVDIEGKKLKMELDTGAALSSISYSDFQSLHVNKRLFKTAVEMKTYTGEIIKPLGVCFVDCKYRDFNFYGKLYVLRQEVEPIFGREWLREVKMDWADIKVVESDCSEKLDKLLTEFQEIFTPGIGKITSEQGHIELKEGARPIFIKPRQVPYALKKSVEEELNRLESNGIISKVENSKWGTPIVPVRKANGNVRICADYKVTANKLICDDKYPIPRIEDIFSNMNKGRYFCTLDISNAYLHLPMDEESREIQTISTHLGLYRVNRMMFGIKVAPSIWQRFMDKVLHGLEVSVRTRYLTWVVDAWETMYSNVRHRNILGFYVQLSASFYNWFSQVSQKADFDASTDKLGINVAILLRKSKVCSPEGCTPRTNSALLKFWQ
ncbi:uncharacterized protein K02A2.6-like [Macrosteles quadrilineatus]|uniref:uncharacterized protein K02A2.6-like n=1 Tax=Macrosteles quadrilineatus TaxID=74068 RepID=UPI0023E1ADD3|nr:uncharacterized protein K02A2.6-like [Macrosteles quadrilineatus]